MTIQQAARRTTVKVPAPLTPAQRAAYAMAIEQTEAIFALEGMSPSPQDKAINAAVLAGQVSPERAREESLSYQMTHKTLVGFIASRSWATR